MFELTNEQRRCFALTAVDDKWTRIEAKQSPYDDFKTFLYLDEETIVKCVCIGENRYYECDLCEKISVDGKYLLPKTSKGRPVLLSSSTIHKRKPIGMYLSYYKDCIYLCNANIDRDYYNNYYSGKKPSDLSGFLDWVEEWCNETTAEDQRDILSFVQEKRRHVRYKEGDVFRFKLTRRLYGYGRILLDYEKMRKMGETFWDILMSKPLVCSVFHIVTERKDVSVDELKELQSLPSAIIADNNLFYGEYEIVGNIPITEKEDYPIMYGSSIHFGESAVCYQCGKTYKKIEHTSVLHGGFRNNGVGFILQFELDVLLKCIEEKSNEPYWKLSKYYQINRDLRNPQFSDKLQEIRQQMNV